jgi:hypothetical protein
VQDQSVQKMPPASTSAHTCCRGGCRRACNGDTAHIAVCCCSCRRRCCCCHLPPTSRLWLVGRLHGFNWLPSKAPGHGSNQQCVNTTPHAPADAAGPPGGENYVCNAAIVCNHTQVADAPANRT